MGKIILAFVFVFVFSSAAFAVDELNSNQKKIYSHIKQQEIKNRTVWPITHSLCINGGLINKSTSMSGKNPGTYDVGCEFFINKKNISKLRLTTDKLATKHCKQYNRKAYYRGFGKAKDKGENNITKGALTILSLGLVQLPGQMAKFKSLSYVCGMDEDSALVAVANAKKEIEDKKIEKEALKREMILKFNKKFRAILIDLDNLNLCQLALNIHGQYNRDELYHRIVKSFDANFDELAYTTANIFEDELRKRKLFKDRNNELEKCNVLTGIYTDKQIDTLQKLKVKEIAKVEMINGYKKDCSNLGFKANTEAMGNCVLKLMEINKTNISTEAQSEEILSVELAKLKIEIERLKLEKARFENEKNQTKVAAYNAQIMAAMQRMQSTQNALKNFQNAQKAFESVGY